jgi:hypothetical protein
MKNFIFLVIIVLGTVLTSCESKSGKKLENNSKTQYQKDTTKEPLKNFLYLNVENGKLQYIESEYPVQLFDTVIVINSCININSQPSYYYVWGLYENNTVPYDYIDSTSYSFYSLWKRIQ